VQHEDRSDTWIKVWMRVRVVRVRVSPDLNPNLEAASAEQQQDQGAERGCSMRIGRTFGLRFG